jgi:hypothetical protein
VALSRPTKALALLGAVMVSLAAATGIVELLLRAFGFSYPALYTRDVIVGQRHRPGFAAWYRDEGAAFIEINNDGFRDREHAVPKPTGVYRIAVLGDSFMEALQVAAEATFVARLEADLGACDSGRRGIDVMNFGVSGFGTSQELLTLRTKVWRYQPDMVILAFYTGNDIRNNSAALEPEWTRPFFVREKDGTLRPDFSFASSWSFTPWGRRLMSAEENASDHVRVLQLIRFARHRRQVAARLRTKGREGDVDLGVYRPPLDAAWRSAWDTTESLLLLMRDEIEARGARFLLVTLSNDVQVDSNREARAALQSALGIGDLFYPDQRLQAFAGRHSIDAVILAPLMQRAADQTGVYFHGFPNTAPGRGHWNDGGHAFAAARIASHICDAWRAGR